MRPRSIPLLVLAEFDLDLIPRYFVPVDEDLVPLPPGSLRLVDPQGDKEPGDE